MSNDSLVRMNKDLIIAKKYRRELFAYAYSMCMSVCVCFSVRIYMDIIDKSVIYAVRTDRMTKNDLRRN